MRTMPQDMRAPMLLAFFAGGCAALAHSASAATAAAEFGKKPHVVMVVIDE
eukprot:SAG22_NODE_281_length_13064_cov_13.367605_10_plen_51_part_00